MNIYEVFPSKYLVAGDLKGKSYTLTIDRVVKETMRSHSGNEDKLVVYFTTAEKGLVLNKTNAFAIADICGIPETDAWKGAKITVYPTRVKAFGEMVDCVRVRAPEAIKDKPQPKPEPVEDVFTDEPFEEEFDF